MKRTGWLLLAVVICISSSGSAANRFENTKPKGVYLGLGLGAASSDFSQDYWGRKLDPETALAGNLRFGFIVRPYLLIGAESGSALFSALNQTWNVSHSSIVTTFYPTKAIFLKAGMGIGSLTHGSSDVGNWINTVEAIGLEFQAAVGLDIRTSNTFSFLPIIQFNYISIDPESYRQVALLLEIGWFW